MTPLQLQEEQLQQLLEQQRINEEEMMLAKLRGVNIDSRSSSQV